MPKIALETGCISGAFLHLFQGETGSIRPLNFSSRTHFLVIQGDLARIKEGR